jgi:transcriptional regulator with XRE-family HTH domain
MNHSELAAAELIGPRIRARRVELGLSLRALARQTGISSSALSQIETGRSLPSIARLYSIVEHLDTTIHDLVPPTGANSDAIASERETVQVVSSANGQPSSVGTPPPASPILVEFIPRPSQTILHLKSGEVWRRLGGRAVSENLEVVAITYPEVASVNEAEYVSHPGTELNYVVSGRLVIDVEDIRYELHEGDSLSLDPTTRHRVTNLGPGVCESLCIFSGSHHSHEQSPPVSVHH